MTDPFARFGAAMVRWRWVVLAIWLVVLVVAGGLLAPRASKVVKAGGFVAPGSESARAAETLERDFNASSINNVVVVFRSPTQTVDDAAFRAEVVGATDRLKAVHNVRSVVTTYNANDPTLVSQDRHTTLALVTLNGEESEVQEEVTALRDQLTGLTIEHYVTGAPAVNHDVTVESERDLRRSELFTIPVVMVLLIIVFRTLVAATVPLVLGGACVVLALAALFGIASAINTSVFALNTASMIGLGLGIDFSLIMITRYREERSNGYGTSDAVARTMATAGRSITYSGITVILAMLALTLLLARLTIVRSISLAVLLVAVTALLAGLTLLPALLGVLGDKLEWARVMPRPKPTSNEGEGIWYRFSHAIMRRPWLWLGASLLLLGVLSIPIKDLRLYGTEAGILPKETESVRGVRALSEGFGATRLTPIQVVIRTEPNGVFRPEFLSALQRLSDTVAADPRNDQVISLPVLAVAAGIPPDQFRNLTSDTVRAAPGSAQFAPRVVNINGDNSTAVITIFSKTGQYEPDHQNFVTELRKTIVPGQASLRPYDVQVGGDAATFLDFRDALYGRFPIVAAVVMAIIYVILMMFFQSVFLPLKAILLNLVSVVATYGVLVLIFQRGWGASLFGFESIGRLGVIVPAVLFAILFALSTDYEVFLLSRVKEYYHETGNNEESVATGLQHTAGVITAAGLILIGTFGSFAAANVVIIKELGLGLAIGILIDSTIVRIVMVPATMRLAGSGNWWMPAWLKRIVPELREGPAPALHPVPAHAAAVAAMPPPYPPANWGVQPQGQAPAQPTDAAPVSPLAQATDLSQGHAPAAPSPSPAPVPVRPVGSAIIGVLHPIAGGVGTDEIVLPRQRPFLIGRDDEADLWLFDVHISRRHARIDFSIGSGEYVVTDLQSANGVSINGQRITTATALRNGDKLTIGDVEEATFVFDSRQRSGAGTMTPSRVGGEGAR